jgi:DNA helicase IV
MRPDFEVVSCLGSRVNHTKERFLTLTEEQYNHLDMIANNPNLKVRLRGGAGTGKTLLAVEQARRCALQGKKVLFLCFNKNLAFFIQHGFEEEGLTENISVWSFHSYAWNTIKQSQLDETQINWRDNDSLLNEMPALFEEAFCQVHEKPPCDVLIIDEGQDLDVTPWVNSLDWLVRKGLKGGTWYWFEDSAQDLFGHSKSAIDDFSPFNLELTKNCRNTKQIGEYTTRLTGCGEMKYLVDNGDEVKVIYYNSLQHQQQLLEKEITKTLSGKVKPEDIVILSHRARGNPKSAIKGIDTLGGKKVVDWQSENPDKNIRFATVQSFKGLESPVIFRIDVEELEKKDKKILNYVSFSRATTLLVVFMSNKLKDKLEVAEAEE